MNKPLKYLEEIKKVLLELPEDFLNMEHSVEETPFGTMFCILAHCADKSPLLKDEGWSWSKYLRKNRPSHQVYLGGDLLARKMGIKPSELWSLCSGVFFRSECAKELDLPTDLNHFNTDTPTTKDAIEVVDILIQRYKKQDDNNAN